MKTLVLFSGGYDSVYLTYRLLVDTKDEVTLVVLGSNTGLGAGLSKDDILRIRPVLEQLRTYRNFKFIFHVVDPNKVTSFTHDHWHAYSIISFADDINAGVYDRIASGTSWEQHDIQHHKRDSYRGSIRVELDSIFTPTLIDKSKIWLPLLTHDFHYKYNRLHLHKYIPLELSVLVDEQKSRWNKILWDLKAVECLAKGWTSDDFDDWRRQKAREYGGGSRDLTYASWITLEYNKTFPAIKGISKDGKDIKFLRVTNKQECIDWYTTLEYNFRLDETFKKWGVTVEDINALEEKRRQEQWRLQKTQSVPQVE
jgi:hypothetical protein